MPKKPRRVTTTAEDHRELDEDLSGVQISEPPPVLSFEVVYPESYTSNGPDEDRLVETAENFQRQFSLLFPDRKPLLLCPVNECGVEKFVCTTLRPTLTVHPDVFDWDGSASFVANFLSLELLEPPGNLPRFLFSSTSVLQSQRATCFEFATLLCSLLLGSGFNAYCVSGYADKDVCLRDHSHQDCPALDSQIQTVMLDQEALENKYLQRRDWDYEFKSQFLVRREEAKAALLEKEKQQKETERRLADPLRGLRVHCWVLVLTGSNCVEENFFIEPLTGLRYDTGHRYFLGIESVWNHRNYYVNMQDCSGGCTDMVYDLEDLNMWEPVLLQLDRTIQDTQVEKKQRGHKMPRSWVGDIIISEKDLETCWPGGHRVTRYKEAELQRFAPYLRPDGLVTRLTTYRDPEYSEVVLVKEWYRHRNDHMEEREVNEVDGFTTERFNRNRSSHLVSHRYQSLSADSVHDLEFRFGRVDGLVRRVVSPGEMTDVYGGRPDKLYYRHVVFNPPDPNPGKYQSREQQVFKVVECYERDRSKTGFEDLAKREFCTTAGRIEMTQHLEDHRPVCTKMTFIKPEELRTKPDVLHSAQVCPCVKMFKKERLEELMKELKEDEKEVITEIFMSKSEVIGIVVKEREQYQQNFTLFPSSGDTAGAAKAAGRQEDMEEEQRLAEEEQSFLEEREADILSTLQIQLDKSDSLSPEDARQLQQNCLTIFKQKLEEHFDLVQESLRKETDDLEEKQQWYQTTTVEKTRRLEAEFKDFCSKKELWIQETQKRLHIFTKAAAQKHREVEQKLRRVPRLANFLWSL